MSQKELADRAGMLKKTVATLESDRGGRAQPGTAGKLADALGVDVDELSEGAARPPGGPRPGDVTRFSAVYERTEGGAWLGRCPEIPEAAARGRNLEEAREGLGGNIGRLLEGRREAEFRRIGGREEVIWETVEVEHG